MAHLVDKRELSMVFNISERTLTEHLKAGLPFVKAPKSAASPTGSTPPPCIAGEIAKRLPAGSESLDPQRERAALDRARRLEVEQRLEEGLGQSIPGRRRRGIMGQAVDAFRAKMLAMPHRLAPLLARETDVGAIRRNLEARHPRGP